MGYFAKATSGLCQPLIAMIPPHDTYKTHLGGGAIMKRKPAALRNIGIDRDARALDASSATIPSNSSTAVPTGIWPSSSFRARSSSTATRRI